MSSNNIYILSRPVRSGKTTELWQWTQQRYAMGILTPDSPDGRTIYDLATKQSVRFEADDTTEDAWIIAVGKFRFLREAFLQAQKILAEASQADPDWLVIDEVGKLELEQQMGFEPGLTQIVRDYQAGKKGKLLLVIRDSLLEKAVNHYQLQKAEVIQNTGALP